MATTTTTTTAPRPPRPRPASAAALLAIVTAVAVAALGACASIPPDRYAVTDIDIEGAEAMDPAAIEACLATRERDRITIQLGISGTPSCGSPPFDADPPRVRLWTWPWNEWPLFDAIVFERDLERIERWYRARGYYDAEVVDWRVEPQAAARSDTVEESTECEREGDDEGCTMQIVVEVFEGEPVIISEVVYEGMSGLPRELRARLYELLPFQEGDRFDEFYYEEAKVALRAALIEASYARAEVTGHVEIDPDAREARVTLTVDHGPICHFGRVTVRGNGHLDAAPLIAASGLRQGMRYSTTAVRDAESAVYDMGVMASVNVLPQVPTDPERREHVIDTIIEVQPADPMRFQLGVGIQSGLVQQDDPSAEVEEVPQWDLHLSASWERRNFFGGWRRLRIEDRPRLVFQDSFPGAEDLSPGNTLTIGFFQPGFPEPRTTMQVTSSWDAGPDPFLDIFRHEIEVGLIFDRYFFHRHLYASVGIRENLYQVPQSQTPPPSGELPASSDLLYLEQLFRLDLRDDPLRTRLGLAASLSLQEAGFFLPSSWSYVRVVPDLRGYFPLFWEVVVMARFSVGAIFLTDSDPALDELSEQLGPTSERLRGGGGSANRGFFPGELGDGPEGGLRRWLATLELRVPVTRDFYLALFADMGDVSREARFRWDHPQTSVGLGFRFLTLIGPIALDFGYRVPGWQVLGGADERDPGGRLTDIDLLLFQYPGAINLTIGDSF